MPSVNIVGGDGFDALGGLVGDVGPASVIRVGTQQTSITNSYATGNVDGGASIDQDRRPGRK